MNSAIVASARAVDQAGTIAATMTGVAAARRRAADTFRSLAGQRCGAERERLWGLADGFTHSAERAEQFAAAERSLHSERPEPRELPQI